MILAFPLMACSVLGGAATDPNEDSIQGTWEFSQTPSSEPGDTLRWTFADGQFTLDEPPQSESGQYTVVSSDDSGLTLRLFNQTGDLDTDDREIAIVIDDSNEQLTIDGEGPYLRISEEP